MAPEAALVPAPPAALAVAVPAPPPLEEHPEAGGVAAGLLLHADPGAVDGGVVHVAAVERVAEERARLPQAAAAAPERVERQLAPPHGDAAARCGGV